MPGGTVAVHLKALVGVSGGVNAWCINTSVGPGEGGNTCVVILWLCRAHCVNVALLCQTQGRVNYSVCGPHTLWQ